MSRLTKLIKVEEIFTLYNNRNFGKIQIYTDTDRWIYITRAPDYVEIKPKTREKIVERIPYYFFPELPPYKRPIGQKYQWFA